MPLRVCKPSTTHLLNEKLHSLASAMSDEGIARTNIRERMEPGAWQRYGAIGRAMAEGFLTPEILAIQRPDTFGKIWRPLARAFKGFQRDQQRHHHTWAKEWQLLTGGKKYGDKNTAGALFLQFTRKKLIIGDEAIDNDSLRNLMKTFYENDEKNRVLYDVLMPGHKFRNVTEGDVQAYREIFRFMEDTLTDKEFDLLRRMSQSMDDVRKMHMKQVRAELEAKIPSKEEIDFRMKEYFGDDLDAYFPVLRDMLRQSDNGGFGVDQTDLQALDNFFGAENIDKDLATELYAIADFMRNNPRNASGFKFKDPDSLGLPGSEYTRVDEALMDLLNIPYSEANKDLVDQMVRIVSGIGTDSHKSRSVIAAISAVPENVRVKYYQKRLISKFPQRHPDLLEGYGAYMNTVLKAIHFNPVLSEAVPIVRATKQMGEHQESAFIANFIYDIVGNPNKGNRELADAMGGITSTFYAATLLGNVSSTVANYLGQTGFVFAEAGLRPTLVAFQALMANRLPGGRQNYLIELMEQAGVGLESVPRGELNSTFHQRIRGFVGSQTFAEAIRRMRRYAVDMLDIFAGSEMRIQKVAYLAGMVRHLENAGVWRPGVASGQLDDAIRAYTANKGNLLKLLHAGDDLSANGAFLFGNINQPGLIRWIKQSPGGFGGSVSMFSNYPIQAMARLGIWTGTAMRFHENPAAAREASMKLFRFFTYGAAVGGPFFMLPVLRGIASEGDEDLAGDLKRMFVAWEKNYSLAGLVGHGIAKMTGEYETVGIAEKISPFPSAVAPAGPLGELFGGPAVQFARNLGTAIGPGFGDVVYSPERIKAREALWGSWVEKTIGSGLGSDTHPFPTGGLSTLMPGGVALSRVLNSFVGTGVLTDTEPVELDRFGRLVRPTSLSTEIIRQFGRPLGEILDATEGRIAEKEAETRTFTIQRLRKAVLEGKMSLVGQLLLDDPSLVHSIEADDISRAANSRELTPQARAMMTSETGLMKKSFRRAIARRQTGNLSPAEEFAVNQMIAVGSMRIRKERERDARAKRAAQRRGFRSPALDTETDVDFESPGE